MLHIIKILFIGVMMDLVYFATSAALGVIGWAVIFATVVWPKIKDQPRGWRLKLLTATHFFRYFGTTMLMVGLVVQKLPAGFANPAAFGDLIAVALAYIAFVSIQRNHTNTTNLPLVWLFNIVGAADLLLAVVLGPMLIKDPANFGFAYFIPVFYVPLLFVTHFYSFKTLTEQPRK